MPITNMHHIAYGDGYISAALPGRTRVIEGNRPLPAVPDVAERIREVIADPIAHEPLHKLVNAKSKVVIA
ncbi:MAG: DUF2088 domain-containing protein, partial [Chloroflexi bacterium]|nr:DUF2088 domain-containing protein [Chloroflexota bacterium]